MEILDENWYFLLTYFKKENFFKNSLLFLKKSKKRDSYSIELNIRMINLDGKRKNSLMIYIREFIISNLVFLPVSHLRMPCTGITIETHSLFPVRYNSLLERLLLLYSSV